MKRVALIIFLLLISAFFCPNHSEASLRLFVGPNEVELKHPMVMIDGNFMIPLRVFEEHLGAEVHVSAEEIQMVFADQTILMQVDVESAQVDGQTYRLDVAPRLISGEIVVPLRFIADRRGLSLVFMQDIMGLRLERSSSQTIRRITSITSSLATEPAEKQGGDVSEEPAAEPNGPQVSEPIAPHDSEAVQDLKEIIFMGGPRSRIFLDVQSYTGYQTHLLTDPDRLVIDLYGVLGDALDAVEVDDPILRSIRSSRFDEQTMRIVCDLKGSIGYRVSQWPAGGLEIEFNYQLTSLRVEERDGMAQLIFQSSAAPVIEAIYLENPRRLVLDFQETTLMFRPFDVAVDEARITRLRVSQHQPSVTRVVLELTEPVAPLSLEKLGAGSFALPLFSGTAREAQAYLASQPLSSPALAEDGLIQDGVLSGLTIVIDPGHGGSDPGAIGYQGTFEKDVNLAIGLYLGQYLGEAGAKVVYTRDKDVYVSIFERPEIVVKTGADLFISIHSNSHIEKGKARGTETLYRAKDPASEVFARTVQAEVVKAITLADRRVWGRDDLAVFNGSTIPSILVEVGFLDHPDEEVLLRAPGFQEVAAQGIYNGIERFYLENQR